MVHYVALTHVNVRFILCIIVRLSVINILVICIKDGKCAMFFNTSHICDALKCRNKVETEVVDRLTNVFKFYAHFSDKGCS